MNGLAWLASIAVASVVFVSAGAALQSWAQRARARRLLARMDLEHNVLLSRWPIAFVSGRRSVFWRSEYWSFAPRYLAEHGFDTFALDLPWAHEERRWTALRAAVDRLPSPCHFLFDSSSDQLANSLARGRHPNVASVTIARSVERSASNARRTKDAPLASALAPTSVPVYELSVLRPTARIADAPGIAVRASFALHRAALALRKDAPAALRTEEIAAFDESLRVERRFLEHAISLAESDAR